MTSIDSSNGGGASFDSIFTATNDGQAVKAKSKPLSTQSYGASSNVPSYGEPDDNLKGRNLGSESISSDRKKTYFQRYVFDSYKY
jgi:hypothetical protein